MSIPRGPNVLLTIDDVRAWKRERETIAARILELDKKLAAVAAFMPDEAKIDVFGSLQVPGVPKVRDVRAVASKFIMDLLDSDRRFFSIAEIEGIIGSSPSAEILTEKPNIVQDVLINTARHGRIRKRGDLFGHNSLEDSIVKKDNTNESYGAAEYFREIILSEIVKHSSGMKTGEIVQLIKSDAKGKSKTEGNSQYPYSLIARMIAKKFIVKFGGTHFHPNRLPPIYRTNTDGKTADPEDAAVSDLESPKELPAPSNAAQAAE